MSDEVGSGIVCYCHAGACGCARISARPRIVPESAGVKSVTNTQAPVTEGEGPWIASCKYWAAARAIDGDDPVNASKVHGAVNESHYTFHATSGHFELHEDANPEGSEQACGVKERWGPPPKGSSVNVTAIIVTVPDPVHTHLAMSFDRKVDALLQAAGDNHYVSSYYWLPWKNRVGVATAAESLGDNEPGHDPVRERQPGLILLKHVPQDDEKESNGSHSYFQVIYLFLVAESPTQGVDGFQLRNAFLYEDELRTDFEQVADTTSPKRKAPEASQKQTKLFSTGPGGRIAIIGPIYTGSAVSLRAGIETATKKLAHVKAPSKAGSKKLNPAETPSFDLAGVTSTKAALDSFAFGNDADQARINYFSFNANGEFEQNVFLSSLKCSGYDLTRVAMLVEDNTALGNEKATRSLTSDRTGQGDRSLGATRPCDQR